MIELFYFDVTDVDVLIWLPVIIFFFNIYFKKGVASPPQPFFKGLSNSGHARPLFMNYKLI